MMAAKYWIKLYHEILDDYKMHKLPDSLWRRTIELFLLAGDTDQDGLLPDLDEIAFRLRVDRETLQKEIEQLIGLGILIEDEALCVKNFEKRQAANSSTERSRKYREREQSGQYKNDETENETGAQRSCNETLRSRDVDTDTDKIQIRTRKEPEQEPEQDFADDDAKNTDEPDENIFDVYENEIGALTPLIADSLRMAKAEFPDHWIRESLRIAAKNNKRSWSYAEKILKRWQVEGFKVDNRLGRDSPGPGANNGWIGGGVDTSNLDKFIRAEGIL